MISEYFRHKMAEESDREFARKVFDETNLRPAWMVWHRACGNVAFFMLKDPRTTDIKSRDVLLFNGTRPPPNSPMICESCGQVIEKLDLLAEQPPRSARIFMGDLK